MYMYFFVSVLVKSCNEKWHHHCFKNVNFLGMNFHFYIVQRFFYTFSLSYWCILESFWEEILLSQRKWADAYFKVILNNKWSSNVHVSAYLYCQIEEKHRKWKYWSLLLKKKSKAITYGIKVHLLMKSTFLNLLELKSRTIHLHVMLVMQCILTKRIKMKWCFCEIPTKLLKTI